ncbi:MAG TPA: hypothetical protein PLY93_02350 [Turneriella sp.]|nr:hypothetical protein [Turneriella sp.]
MVHMKFKHIKAPARTLVVSTLDVCYNAFTVYFLKLWCERFATKPDFNVDSILTHAYSVYQEIPTRYSTFLKFILTQKYKTVIFLNPNAREDRALRWATRTALIKNRVGFNPLKGVNPLNLSLPFNTENHHYVHQLKIFFEYITGEKVHHWENPSLPSIPENTNPVYSAAVLSLDAHATASKRLAGEFAKLINFVTRTTRLTLFISGSQEATQNLSRTLSVPMTEKALTNTLLTLNPSEEEKLLAVRNALWVTGTDICTLNMAGLAQTPSLSIFGPLNERVWQPFSTRARILAGEFDCRPCTHYPGKVECKNPLAWQCLSGVTAELILATLNGMLTKHASKP